MRSSLSLSALLLASALTIGCGGKSKPMTATSPTNSAADEAAPGGGEEDEASADPCGGTEDKKRAPDGADPCGGGE